ncbi:SRPBCC domain-containing protein [Myxococcus sp. CA051A]|uniref:SRPBCC domain-containing protein n=1 Tax=Myxococcus sp. CA051A TaxID=2741739 RepID=UPI00157BA81B|nr:SRPBCC domain-containing protein [Myxococcus sp. CA051A]NTX67675.1 SRPBCC domain-containing protein [Myxococcus sp. CA051A]
MFRLRTESFIDSPPEAVWAVLEDFARYSLWNPLLLEARGRVERGAHVKMKVRSPDGSGRVYGFTATMSRVDRPEALEWTGGIPGVLHGRHYFLLSAEGTGMRLVHGEDFSGVVTWVAGRKLKALQSSYEALNRALAERVMAERANPLVPTLR